jgi:hypothetical protein
VSTSISASTANWFPFANCPGPENLDTLTPSKSRKTNKLSCAHTVSAFLLVIKSAESEDEAQKWSMENAHAQLQITKQQQAEHCKKQNTTAPVE